MQREHNWTLTMDLAMKLATLNNQFHLIEICEFTYIKDNYNLVTEDHPYTANVQAATLHTTTTTAIGQAPSMKVAHSWVPQASVSHLILFLLNLCCAVSCISAARTSYAIVVANS